MLVILKVWQVQSGTGFYEETRRKLRIAMGNALFIWDVHFLPLNGA
jgi:hypothetical protein